MRRTRSFPNALQLALARFVPDVSAPASVSQVMCGADLPPPNSPTLTVSLWLVPCGWCVHPQLLLAACHVSLSRPAASFAASHPCLTPMAYAGSKQLPRRSRWKPSTLRRRLTCRGSPSMFECRDPTVPHYLSCAGAEDACSDRLDGNQKPIPYSVLLKRPDLRHRASIIK